ncbi:Adenylate cyclase type 9 [Fasciolopsis buskii]|uniref:adenylate cyclase n=1 Tax=Fasciolopsis buskii TaxID=27845 RepID=A0A8E0S0S3_9TREM|nr:Adenylate cyclase type 9 [Fasciolopsis buski]
MRVGVHTGKVICGIVGTRRFKFDVWSNDVTLANEMESSGQAGKVHISEATYGFVKDIYEVSDGESVQDIRKFKVLIEFFNKEEQCFAIKHTQDEAMIKTYFIERRLDGKPVYALPPVSVLSCSLTCHIPFAFLIVALRISLVSFIKCVSKGPRPNSMKFRNNRPISSIVMILLIAHGIDQRNTIC